MKKQLEEYLLEIIKDKKTGFFAKIVLIILSVLELIYLIAIKLRELFYKIGIFKTGCIDTKVISVGNITTGGTGKTPVVEKLAYELFSKGNKVVVLSRGYRSKGNDTVIISDGKKILTDIDTAGDELYMMASHLDNIPVVKGKNRLEAGKKAVEEFNPDVVIVDDSFQHWKLERDIDIVVIDALNPFGYEHLLPRGLLREPLSALKRADMFIISKTDHVNDDKLKNIRREIKRYNNTADIYLSMHEPINIVPLASASENKIEKIDSLESKNVFALSGIGNPESFKKGLEELGVTVVEMSSYPDHYDYSKQDVMDIAMEAQLSEAEMVITTDKDAIKMNQEIFNYFKKMDVDLYSLGIELNFIDEINFSKEIMKLIK